MKVLLIVVGLLAVVVLPLLFMMFYGMGDIRKLVIREVDLSKIADGLYNGSYHKGRWTYDVEVAVKDHRIVSIKNTNKRTRALKDWNERAAATMIDRQAIAVDVVSGATLNSKAFEKAVEVALTTAPTHGR